MFLGSLAGGLPGAPLVAAGQQTRTTPRIALVLSNTPLVDMSHDASAAIRRPHEDSLLGVWKAAAQSVRLEETMALVQDRIPKRAGF